MKNKIFLYSLIIILIFSISNCKENPHKKEERHTEKKEKKNKKTEEKNYVIKTSKSEEEMNQLFSDSTLKNLKEREKKTKEDKKIEKELSKITKVKKSNSNSKLITQGLNQNITSMEDDDDDDERPFDDFLLREVDYIDDTQINKMNTNLLKVNDNNIKETSYNNFRVGYAFLYFLFIICFILFSFHALYSKKEIVEKEFILESDKMDSYLLNDSNYL
jgi:hypothetical protein